MIIVMAYKIFEEKYPVERKVVHKFPNDYDFGFNTGDPYQWRQFLKKRFPGLPQSTKKGVAVAYRVYIWGALKGVKAEGQGSGTTLFPGYDPKTGKRLTVAIYGRLDAKNDAYWASRRTK